MILDDLHWADDSTLSLLYHLTQRLPGLPLMVIGTYRDAELNVTRELAKTLEDLLRARLATRVRLKGLPRDEVAAMLNSLSGKLPPSAVVGDIRRNGRKSFLRRGTVPPSRRGRTVIRLGRPVSLRAQDCRIGRAAVRAAGGRE